MSKSKLKVKNTYTRSVLFLCLILAPILYFLYSYNVYHGNRNQTIYLILFIVTLLFLFVSFISVLLNRKDNPMSRDYVTLLFLVNSTLTFLFFWTSSNKLKLGKV